MISSFSKLANNMDFKWNNPKTYAILIPGLSFAIQLIQLNDLTPKLLLKDKKLSQNLQTNVALVKQLDYSSDEKFIKVCRLHFVIGIAQCVALMILFGTPLPPLLAITPTLQILHAMYKSFSNSTITYDASSENLHISSMFGFGGLTTNCST